MQNNDLISRSALLDKIGWWIEDMANAHLLDERYYRAMKRAEAFVEEMPAVDAVEVVRCKDCLNCGMKASIKYDGYRDDVRLCMLHGIAVLPDDYCSGGVKMDAEVEV